MSQTLKQAIAAARQRLLAAGIEDAAFNVDQMVAEILKVSAGRLPALWNNCMDDAFCHNLEAMIDRRCRHEPLQYIVENWAFLDFDVIARPGALIPRPETEEVFLAAEKAVKECNLPDRFRFIDVCTGSGVLGLATALRFSESMGWLTDISYRALETAAINLQAKPALKSRVHVIQSDMLAAFASNCIDLIISNPPYIDSEELEQLMPEVRDFEPHLALDGGAGGLILIDKLLCQSAEILRSGGLLVFEHGHGQRSEIFEMIDENAWDLIKSGDDMQGNERFFILLKR